MPIATVNVVLGKSTNPVPDVEELCRKREEDAAVCGRIIRTIPKPGTREGCPTRTLIVSDDDDDNHDMATTMFSEVIEFLPTSRTILQSTGSTQSLF